jgi:D-aminopeptidase
VTGEPTSSAGAGSGGQPPVTPRASGIRIGAGEPGPANAITDVPGVRVGHVTVWRDEPPPPAGRGVARTGVTAIVPASPDGLLASPAPAGAAVLNGAGEMTGFLQVSEWGVVETPIYLTATMAVGRVYDGAVAAAIAADPAVGREQVVIPVVAECDDSWLSDAAPVQVEAADAGAAIAAAAGGPVEQGAVGAGTGMVCFGWKGGIGTASRRVPEAGATLGVLVLANFGSWAQLRIDGVPVGRHLGDPDGARRRPAGSCIAVVATDVTLAASDLARVARRAGLGLARTGSVAHHGSGEIFVAFATPASAAPAADPPLTEPRAPEPRPMEPRAPEPRPMEPRPMEPRPMEPRAPEPCAPADLLDALFAATVEATEEAVLNALWFARDVTGRDGRTVRALPRDDVVEILAAHGRLAR